MIERLEAEAKQRDADRERDARLRSEEIKQQADLQKALDEARQAREALSAAERLRAEADKAAEQANAEVARMLAERDAAAVREAELRTAQKRLLTDASAQSTSERAAAISEPERKLAAVTAEAQAARTALAAAETRQREAAQASLNARRLSQDAKDRNASALVASLPPSNGTPTELAPDELIRRLQMELKRVGCYSGEIDGTWGGSSKSALEAFARTTGLELNSAEPSAKIVGEVASQLVRICPLKCAPNQVEHGGKCIAAAPQTHYTAPLSKTNRPDAKTYSRNYWPPRSLTINGPAVTANTPYGILTCRSYAPASRECSWK
jgi:peptidoglycan hydrolase-like protein with peptidoglycan-binding domain